MMAHALSYGVKLNSMRNLIITFAFIASWASGYCQPKVTETPRGFKKIGRPAFS